jgi:hypothetical protein
MALVGGHLSLTSKRYVCLLSLNIKFLSFSYIFTCALTLLYLELTKFLSCVVLCLGFDSKFRGSDTKCTTSHMCETLVCEL